MIDEKKLLDDLIKCKELGRKSCMAVADIINSQPKTEGDVHTLDRGLLAEAISICSDKISSALKKISPDSYCSVGETICLNEILKIEVMALSYVSYSRQFKLYFRTYVKNIEMAEYCCILDLWEKMYDPERFRRWDRCTEEIFHTMPDRFVKLMNDWSRQSVSKFDKKRRRRNNRAEEEKKEVWNREEAVLNRYRQGESKYAGATGNRQIRHTAGSR